MISKNAGNRSTHLVVICAAVLLGAMCHSLFGGLTEGVRGGIAVAGAATSPHGLAVGGEQPAVVAQEGEHASGGHADPFSRVLIDLAVLIAVAWFGRWAAGKLKQPSVLGELILGVVIGNIGYWLGRPIFVLLMHMDSAIQLFNRTFTSDLPLADVAKQIFSSAELAAGGAGAQVVSILSRPEAPVLIVSLLAIWIFSNLGVILLLFMVGLESSVDEMLRVGPRATLVACVGVVAPFALGVGAGLWLMPAASMPVHLFIGATLAATSVGITARVFKDLDRVQSKEAKVILGAAVIDDILGLILLAVMVGIVQTGELQWMNVGRILTLSVIFLGAVILLGDRFVRATAGWVHQRERKNLKLLLPLFLAFFGAWLSNLIGLAAIVGAFAAGLVLTEKQFTFDQETHSATVEEMVAPLEALFAPIFFVLMGLQVNLRAFARADTIGLAVALIVVAILGKLVSGWAAGKGMDKLSVGIGMVPRGEVGLIFASIGKGLGVVNDAVFSAIVMMVIVTTLITPVALKWSLFRPGARHAA